MAAKPIVAGTDSPQTDISRAARWSACPPAPTWSWSAGTRSTPGCLALARFGTPC